MPLDSTFDEDVAAGRPGADEGRRHRLGAFYTPNHVVEYMTGLLASFDVSSRFLEPSGGDGAFVAGLLAAGADPAAVEVWDIDPAARSHIEELGVSFVCRDSLLDPGPPGRFTHVVGNPPYLNKHSDYIRANRAALAKRWAVSGASETYAMFIALALEQLADGGQLVFLVSDTFLTLGTHRKLRKLLLSATTVDQVALLPRAVFRDAAVSTAVLVVSKREPPAGHLVRVVDMRGSEPGVYDAAPFTVPQAELAASPGHLFVVDPSSRLLLDAVASLPPLMDLLDGGLGMYTGNNGEYVAVVDDGSGPLVSPRGLRVVRRDQVDGQLWRSYHKRGGVARWFAPAEHAVRWDEASRAAYTVPASAALADAGRPGLIVSGVASALTARVMTPGAMWESNKAFGLFPKDPARHRVEFFLAVLNSAWYRRVARALNHTASFQMRDVRLLPLLPFTVREVAQLAELGAACVECVAAGRDAAAFEARIDAVVEAVACRAGMSAAA